MRDAMLSYRSVLIGGVVLASLLVISAPPTSFPESTEVPILVGDSASSVAHRLQSAGVIRYPRVFTRVLQFTGASDSLHVGVYFFSTPEGMLAIAKRLRTGDMRLQPVSITFPEGSSLREMAARVHEALPHISETEFRTEAAPHLGYLFPDTYRFLPTDATADVLSVLRKTFDERVASLEPEIQASGRSLADIVVMASLLEKEARSTEVRKIVSGILWDRIRLGMPLQVDAVFGFIFDRETYSPSYADLKVDSPYNTYTHRGLPPGPINNPGLDSLRAAVLPTPSPYLYYLTDNDGVMHYARTYAEHERNIERYLR